MADLLRNEAFLAGLKIAFAIGFTLQLVPLLIWAERKVCAYIQDRVGPNRAALFGTIRAGGMVHSLSDAIKMLGKEDIRPSKSNRAFYVLGPFLVVVPALLILGVIPWADDLDVPRGAALPPGPFALQVARLDVGILYVFAIAGLSVFGIMLAGWASNNKFSLLGGLRAASQLVSYEIALTLSAVSMMLLYGTVRLEQMVEQQGSLWGVMVQPIAFVVFLIAIFAESNRLPFDLPEGESELVAGYHTEYSGFKFGLFMMAEYVHMIVSSAIVATVFFGGWQVPFLTTGELRANAHQVLSGIVIAHGVLFAIAAVFLLRRFAIQRRRWHDRRDYEPLLWGVLLALGALGAAAFAALRLPHELSVMEAQWIAALAQFMVLVAKIAFFLFVFLWVRWTLPRFRFDHVMRLGWKMLMPIAIANIVVTAAIVFYTGGLT